MSSKCKLRVVDVPVSSMDGNPLIIRAHPKLVERLSYRALLFTKGKSNGNGKTIIDTDGWATGNNIGKWLPLIVNASGIVENTSGYNAAAKRYWFLTANIFQILSIQTASA